nr:immunoglobulin heavy chain junction region [Macaca mulatta]MOW19934.1 immunoglobulin heavy chain junction region [Macaca mulatta]MOW20075.1 immunoglobulin heavy chain junction region [Macaca mulatta]MOW20681.1 immunoglobulin heavy chain junction region [Macaca mulatta]MOW20732.1 immunoglobulin heavy chain junction region [Macaca mulatta]
CTPFTILMGGGDSLDVW